MPGQPSDRPQSHLSEKDSPIMSPLLPLCCYLLALLALTLVGSAAIVYARQHLAPAPIQEVL